MILTTTRHGRTSRDVRNLKAHLTKSVGQVARVVAIGNVPLSDADAALAYMEAMRDGSRATVSMHHVAISPLHRLDGEQLDETVRRILAAMGAEDHAWVLWEHDGKARSERAADQHFHLVVGHIGPDGKALDDGWSYLHLEAAARSLEHDFGEPLTASRKTISVAAILRGNGRHDVADRLVPPDEPPRSATSSARRAAAARAGVDLPKAQAAVRAAWTAADSPAAFRAAIAEQGFDVAEGRKPGVFVVSAGDAEIGALDRIVKLKRAVVAQRMKELDHAAADPAPASDAEISDGRPEGGLRPESGSEPGGPEARAAVELAGPAGGRDVAYRAAAGDPGDHRPRAAAAPPLPRGPARQDGRHGRFQTARLNASLRGFRPTPETRAAAAEIHVRSFAGRFPALRSALLARQLGGLDRVRRLAWELRSTISEIRLRIRFGDARPAEPVRVPEASPTSTDLMRNRIREALVSRRSRPEIEEPRPPGFRM